MAASLILDEIEGSQLEAAFDGTHRRIRRGRIRNIDVSGSTSVPDARVLEKALAVTGMPALGSAYPAGTGTTLVGLSLQRIIIRPRTARMATVELLYDVTQIGGITATYLIRDSSRLVREVTNMIPGNRFPVMVGWKNPDFDIDDEFVPFDYVQFAYERHYRVVSISATINNLPPLGNRQAMGRVNDATWYGYPRGYWRVDAFEADSRDRGSTYQIQTEVASRIDEDWATYGILMNKHTGKYVKVNVSDVDFLVAFDYQYGLKYPTPNPDPLNSGIVKIGPYKLVNFAALYGF